jgi:hypothetical protein
MEVYLSVQGKSKGSSKARAKEEKGREGKEGRDGLRETPDLNLTSFNSTSRLTWMEPGTR